MGGTLTRVRAEGKALNTNAANAESLKRQNTVEGNALDTNAASAAG